MLQKLRFTNREDLIEYYSTKSIHAQSMQASDHIAGKYGETFIFYRDEVNRKAYGHEYMSKNGILLGSGWVDYAPKGMDLDKLYGEFTDV